MCSMCLRFVNVLSSRDAKGVSTTFRWIAMLNTVPYTAGLFTWISSDVQLLFLNCMVQLEKVSKKFPFKCRSFGPQSDVIKWSFALVDYQLIKSWLSPIMLAVVTFSGTTTQWLSFPITTGAMQLSKKIHNIRILLYVFLVFYEVPWIVFD